MPLKDYILELFKSADLRKLLTPEYKQNIESLIESLGPIVAIVILICFILGLMLGSATTATIECERKNQQERIRNIKLQVLSTQLNYGILRQPTYSQFCNIYNFNSTQESINSEELKQKQESINPGELKQNSAQNNNNNQNFHLTSDDLDNIVNSLKST